MATQRSKMKARPVVVGLATVVAMAMAIIAQPVVVSATPATAQPVKSSLSTTASAPTSVQLKATPKDRVLSAKGHRSLALAKKGQSSPPKASTVSPRVVSAQGDVLDITGLLEASAHPLDSYGRTSDCATAATMYSGTIFSPCGNISVYDATFDGAGNTSQAHLPSADNSQVVQVWDGCGQQVLNDYTWGWHALYTPWWPRFQGGWTTTSTYITLDETCFGTWTQSYSFTQTFTDGQTLNVTLASTFSVYPDVPAVTQSVSQSYGGSVIHATQADPVDSQTGAFNYHPEQPDLVMAARGGPLAMARAYASNTARAGSLGTGWSFAYDADVAVDGITGNVTYHDPTGSIQVFTPDGSGGYTSPPGVLSRLTLANAVYTLTFKTQTRFVFDAAGKLTAVRDRNGQGPTLAYTGNLLQSASDSGRTLTYTHDAVTGLISAVTASDGRSVHYAYDSAQHLIDYTNAGSSHTLYTYDTSGRLNAVQDANSHYVVRLTYDDATGRVVQQLDAADGVTTFGWAQSDPSNPGTGTSTVTTPRGKVWTDKYLNGYLIDQTDPDAKVTHYSWTDNGEPLRVVSPDGTTTWFAYDAAGNLIKRTLGYQSETYAYNSRNDLTTTTDFNGNLTSFTYDGVGNLASVTRPNVTTGTGTVVSTSNVYNADGTLKSTKDALLATTTFGYNTAGDLISTTSPTGRVTTNGRDGAGRVINTVDPRGNVAGGTPATYRTTITYDNTDHQTQVTDPMGHSTNTAYDPTGAVRTMTNPKGAVTTFTRDNEGRVVTAQGPDTTVAPERYTYDADGNVATHVSPGGLAVSYAYDNLNRKASITSPAGTWAFTYDANGRQTSQTAPSGRSATLNWAWYGLTSVVYNDATPSVSYGYDRNGNRTSVYAGTVGATYQYNALNEVTKTTTGTDVFAYTFDNNGQLISKTYPGTAAQQLTYDPDGRLTKVASGTATLASYAYDTATGKVTTQLPSGVVTTQTIDAAARPAEVKSVKGTTTLARSTYALDANGNPTQITNRDGSTDTYTYNILDRLTKACYVSTTCAGATNYISWGYDADGNRLQQTTPTGATTYTYNAAERLVSRSGADGAANYTYDGDGNLTNDGTSTYAWNAAGQLLSATVGTNATTYTYDGNNNRTSITQAGTTTTETNDPTSGKLALERDRLGKTLRQYNYGLTPIGFVSANATFNYLLDGTGSVRAVTDSAGAAQLTYDYTPYGTTRATTVGKKPPTNLLRFAGAYTDGTAYHLGAREYRPELGIFLSPDPAMGAGLGYNYANANPMVFIDPTGLDGIDWISVIHDVSSGVATVSAGISIGCLVAVVCAEVDVVTGPLALAASAVSAATSDSTRSCVSGKGGCGAAVIQGALVAVGGGLYGLGRLGSVAEAEVPTAVFSRGRAPGIAENFDNAVANGAPTQLNRVSAAARDANRRAALRGQSPAPAGQSLDEYPFACSAQGGCGSFVRSVPGGEQNYQGGVLSRFFQDNGIGVGDPFNVMFGP